MEILRILRKFLISQSQKAEDNFDKGYDRAEKLSDEQIKAKLNDPNKNVYEKAGMAQAYKDRK